MTPYMPPRELTGWILLWGSVVVIPFLPAIIDWFFYAPNN